MYLITKPNKRVPRIIFCWGLILIVGNFVITLLRPFILNLLFGFGWAQALGALLCTPLESKKLFWGGSKIFVKPYWIQLLFLNSHTHLAHHFNVNKENSNNEISFNNIFNSFFFRFYSLK